MLPDELINSNPDARFVYSAFMSDSLFIPNEDDGSTVGTSVVDLTLPGIEVYDLTEPVSIVFPNVSSVFVSLLLSSESNVFVVYSTN